MKLRISRARGPAAMAMAAIRRRLDAAYTELDLMVVGK
jgi:hypothetical protein